MSRRLEGAVSHVIEAGPQGWKGLSCDAFTGAWLERKTRMQQASLLMNEAAGYLSQLARVIEDNVPLIRAEQSIQLQPVFQSMNSNDQQMVLESESQAQQTILMALSALNGQLEQLGEEIGDCPQEDKEAGEPWYERNISRSSTGGASGGGAKTPEERIEDAVGDPVIAQDLIDLAYLQGINLDEIANLLEKGIEPDTVTQLISNGANLDDIAINAQALLDRGVKIELIDGWLQKDGTLSDLKLLLDNGATGDQIATWFANGDLGPGNTVTPFDGAIKKALRSRNPGDNLEGVVARIAKMAGYDITAFQQDIFDGPRTVTDIDVATPDLIIEVKSGRTWDSKATIKLQAKLGEGPDGGFINPKKEPVIVYAPGMPANRIIWIERTGAYVARNAEELIQLLSRLHPK